VTGLHDETVGRLGADRVMAHEVLFKHRHGATTPDFHREMIEDLHSPAAKRLTIAFRGSGKSTLAEEALIIMASFGEFRNCVLIGESYQRACDRLRAIRFEFETNDLLRGMFDDQIGSTWQEAKLVLKNGVCLQALGSGQSLRGVKHLDARPDFCFIDDLESEDTASTPEAREKLSSWVYAVLLRALEPFARLRMAATPLDPEALAVKLMKDEDWNGKVYPVEYLDEDGIRRASWPEKYPLAWIDRERDSYVRAGKLRVWEQEMMCRAVDPATRIFLPAQMRYEPRVRTFEPVFAVYDPARTVGRRSAGTGRAIGSWVGSKLIIWEASGPYWRPDEIIADMFEVDEKYAPVLIGVEIDGLEEFIKQPLRAAQIERRKILPLEMLRAPKGKEDFIKGLQPYFAAREVIFAGARESFVQAEEQLVNFPTGLKDIPNAMAYLLRIRPGHPVYAEFSNANIAILNRIRGTFYLGVNADHGATTGVLVQFDRGALHVLAAWVEEEDPGVALRHIVESAALEAGSGDIVCYAPRSHFGTGVDQIGLRAAALKIPIEMRRGGDLISGRGELRRMTTSSLRGQPAFLVASSASWVLRALSGGYAFPFGKDEPKAGIYRTLVEGLEGLAGLLGAGLGRQDRDVHWETARDGRKYISARG